MMILEETHQIPSLIELPLFLFRESNLDKESEFQFQFCY